MNIQQLQAMKSREKITMVTCYDAWTAKILANKTNVNCLLVGDTVAMVVHGYSNTLHATLEMMALHVAAVAKGANQHKLLIGDLPFCSYRKSLSKSILAMETLMRAGAHAIKLEGVEGNLKLIKHAIHSGIPIMGHIGLMPQSIFTAGGFKLQGKDEYSGQKLLEQAKKLQDAGAFSVVLECIPSNLAQKITNSISIPTIGIGAGPSTDGQVLVLQDLLGFSEDFSPKFLKKYADGVSFIQTAVNDYVQEVCTEVYPDATKHAY